MYLCRDIGQIILQERKKAVNVSKGVAWWRKGRSAKTMNILNRNCDFLLTKNFDNMKVNAKNIFFWV
jgi:hypothetical protein